MCNGDSEADAEADADTGVNVIALHILRIVKLKMHVIWSPM